MKIAIKQENRIKIAAALMDVNGNASAHTYTKPADIDEVVGNAEHALKFSKLPKTYQVGAKFTSTSGERTANSYKYSRQATEVVICKGSGGKWFLVGVNATTINVNGGNQKLLLSANQDEKCIEQLRKHYSVLKTDH